MTARRCWVFSRNSTREPRSRGIQMHLNNDFETMAVQQERGAVRDWLACALLLSIVLALYGASLHFEFVWDDTAYIRENYRVHALDWIHLKSFWTRTYLGHYAPLHHLLLALVYSIDGNDPFYFHLANLLIHGAAVVMLYALIKRIESPRVALLASLLYVVHPTHAETVAWVAESKSTLAFLFFLIAAWFFVRHHESGRSVHTGLSVLFYILSALTKINTVVAPAIFVMYDFWKSRTIREMNWRASSVFGIASLALVGAHLQAFGTSDEMLDGIRYSPFGVRLMNFPMLLSFYVDTMLLPYNLSAWEQFPVQPSFTWVVGLAWAGLALMALFLLRAGKDIQFWVAWFVIFLLPVLQFVPFPIWVADRYLYIPLVGGSVLLARLILWAWDRFHTTTERRVLAAACGLSLVVLAWRTHVQLPIWRDDLSLWGGTTPKCQQSAYCRSSYGLALMSAGKLQQGGDELVEAVRLRPVPLFLGYLGDALTISARNYPEAVKTYKLALQNVGNPREDPFGPRNGVLYAKLARAYMKQGQLDLASQAIHVGAAHDLRNPVLATADVFLQWKLGDMTAARGSLEAVSNMTGERSNFVPYMDRFWADTPETKQMLRDVLAPRQ